MSTIVLNAGRPTCYLFNGPLEAVSFLPFLSVARSLLRLPSVLPQPVAASCGKCRKQHSVMCFERRLLRDLLLGVGVLRFKFELPLNTKPLEASHLHSKPKSPEVKTLNGPKPSQPVQTTAAASERRWTSGECRSP